MTTLVDEWARSGLRHAVVCPGSRSTPLAVALAEHPDVAVQVHHDERSGGFLALGAALATGDPVVVVTTSGTAAAELHPAVVEAHQAAVPLVVCTADRPPELRDVGAPQTIDQTRLYGGSVRWFVDPGVPDLAAAPTWRSLAGRAWAEAGGRSAGPVHLNLPFREPLIGRPGPLPGGRGVIVPQAGGGVMEEVGTLGSRLRALSQRRGLVVAGGGSGPASVACGEALGWPVVADPRSPAWAPGSINVLFLDGVLRSKRAREELRPEVILRFGEPPASRVVNEWCAGSGAEEIVVSAGRWSDPSASAASMLRADPGALAQSLVGGGHLGHSQSPGDASWLATWQAVSLAARDALRRSVDRVAAPNEPAVARAVVAGIPAGGDLVVSSSMPIRDVERYAEPRGDIRVLANRGANGIDGVVSTAVGVAAGGRRPTGLLIGDVALLHDSNGLLGAAARGVDLVVVVVDNDGGGIFSFLPQAGRLDHERFDQLFGTPHGLDLVELARAFQVEARWVGEKQGEAFDLSGHIEDAFGKGGVHVLAVRTDRSENVAVHRVLDDAIALAVDEVLDRT